MKIRTAFISAILSLIPFGQPLLIKTGVVLSTTSFMISLPEKVNANKFLLISLMNSLQLTQQVCFIYIMLGIIMFVIGLSRKI